jgi:hypothetical protein
VDIFNSEFLNLVKSFHETEVRYIIVGGFSTNFHGYKRATGDIDFWIEDSTLNRKNLIKAFYKMGYGEIEELMRVPLLPGYCEVMLDSGIYADLMDSILGFTKDDFTKCFDAAVIAGIEGVPVRFLHYNHLLHSKENSERLKDRLDAEELRKINKNM